MNELLIKKGSTSIAANIKPVPYLHIVSKRLFRKPVESDVKVEDICFYHSEKTLYKKWVCFGTLNESFSFKLSVQDADKLIAFIQANNPLYKKEEGTFYSFRSLFHFLTPERLWLTPQACSYVHLGLMQKYVIGRPKVTIVSVPDVVFYNYSGIIRKKIYFGRYSQIVMARPEADFDVKLKKYLIANGAKIGAEAQTTYYGSMLWKNFYKPSHWFIKESVGLTDEALIFNRKTFTSIDTNYIEYDKIDVAMISSLGWGRKGLIVLGELNAISKQYFSGSTLQELFKKLKEKGVRVPSAEGSEHKPSPWWFEWFKNIFKSPVKIYSDDEFLYVKPGRLGGLYDIYDPESLFDDFENIDEAKKTLKNIKKYRCKNFSAVKKSSYISNSFNKAHFWNFWGVATLKFECPQSIRIDQSNQRYYYIVIVNISRSKLNDLISEIKRKN